MPEIFKVQVRSFLLSAFCYSLQGPSSPHSRRRYVFHSSPFSSTHIALCVFCVILSIHPSGQYFCWDAWQNFLSFVDLGLLSTVALPLALGCGMCLWCGKKLLFLLAGHADVMQVLINVCELMYVLWSWTKHMYFLYPAIYSCPSALCDNTLLKPCQFRMLRQWFPYQILPFVGWYSPWNGRWRWKAG